VRGLPLAKPGTFKLVPPPERIAALRRDYLTMRDLYLSEPMDFERILETLGDLELRMNEEKHT
jgi:hypothetical protein